MPDQIGGTQVPLVAPAAGDVVSDPLLQVTLAFLRAYLQDDFAASNAWAAVDLVPTAKVVRATFAYDPRKDGLPFSDKDLPALYLFRGESVEDWEGEDRIVEVTQLHLFWIMPPDSQAKRGVRDNIVNGIRKAIVNGIENGRTPSFKVNGDPDAKAAGLYGSAFGAFTGAEKIRVSGSRPCAFIIGSAAQRQAAPRSYQGLEMLLTARELRVRGVDAPKYQLLAHPNGAFDVTLTINGGPSKVEGRSP